MDLEKLYYTIDDKDIDRKSNPFYIVETDIAEEKLFSKLKAKFGKELSVEFENDLYDDFVNAIESNKKQAFKVGYRTALELLLKV